MADVEDYRPEVSGTLPPWHMWGTHAILSATQTGPLAVVAQGQQLARVNYKRPEHWRFWLGARLVGGNVNAGIGVMQIAVHFAVIIGVGRSNFATQATTGNDPALVFNKYFHDFVFVVPVGVAPGQQNDNIKYVTQVTSPPTNDNIATSTTIVNRLVAQDIQCSCSLELVSVAVGQTVQAEAYSFFAPNVHVRPDWYEYELPGAQFLGAEKGGA
jgi:hypothetical protein